MDYFPPYFQQKKLVVKDMANKAVVRAFLAYLLNLGQFSFLELARTAVRGLRVDIDQNLLCSPISRGLTIRKQGHL